MVNQQLLDYLREQLKSGVNRKDLKDTLLSVGWQELDINEAFEIIDKELTQNSDTIKNQDSNLVNLKNIVANSLNSADDFNKNVNNLNSSPQYISKNDLVFAKSDSITVKDQKQIEDSVLNNSNLNTIQPQQIKIESLPKNHKKFKIILYIIFSLVIIGFLILIFFMYQKNNELENKLTETLARSGDLESQSQGISQTINDLQKQILSLKNENNSLIEEKTDLLNNLSLFSQSTSSLDIELRGKIFLEKGQYVFKTNKDIIVNIKNSKDKKVKTVLDSFLNQDLIIKGLRTPGLREATITDINNQSIDNLYIVQMEAQFQNQTSTQGSNINSSPASNLNIPNQNQNENQNQSLPFQNP